MKHSTAEQDLVQGTLARLVTDFSRLAYLAGLRTEDGYGHWGLARVHGGASTADAIGRAHTEVFLQVLETSVRDTLAELRRVAALEQQDVPSYLDRVVSAGSRGLAPRDLGGGSAKHLEWLLFVLSKLAEAEAARTGRAA